MADAGAAPTNYTDPATAVGSTFEETLDRVARRSNCANGAHSDSTRRLFPATPLTTRAARSRDGSSDTAAIRKRGVTDNTRQRAAATCADVVGVGAAAAAGCGDARATQPAAEATALRQAEQCDCRGVRRAPWRFAAGLTSADGSSDERLQHRTR